MRIYGKLLRVKGSDVVTRARDGEEIQPWANAIVKDSDDGEKRKVKPQDSDDLPEFKDMLSHYSPGDEICWVVEADKYGNLRFVEEYEAA